MKLFCQAKDYRLDLRALSAIAITMYRFDGVELLDPFAGFGSIPLEAMRLGLKATAVELLPTAYVFLKAVL
ncbi:MAG: hypothetical protein QXO75_06895, partial [Nitrososphaerota archaeon]